VGWITDPYFCLLLVRVGDIIYGYAKNDGLGDDVVLVQSSQASTSLLVNDDWDQLGYQSTQP